MMVNSTFNEEELLKSSYSFIRVYTKSDHRKKELLRVELRILLITVQLAPSSLKIKIKLKLKEENNPVPTIQHNKL